MMHRHGIEVACQDAKEAIVEDAKDGEGWVSTHVKAKEEEKETIANAEDEKKIADAEDEKKKKTSTAVEEKKREEEAEEENEDDIPDMDEFEDDNLVEADPGMLLTDNIVESKDTEKKNPVSKGIIRVVEPEDNIERTRTYDISITYDKYYQTPRIFLFGYDRDRQPLTPKKIMEDISADHAHKTVTVDPHPHLEVPHASIHPCRHAPVMLRICERMEEANVSRVIDEKKEIAKKKGKELKPEDLELTSCAPEPVPKSYCF